MTKLGFMKLKNELTTNRGISTTNSNVRDNTLQQKLLSNMQYFNEIIK